MLEKIYKLAIIILIIVLCGYFVLYLKGTIDVKNCVKKVQKIELLTYEAFSIGLNLCKIKYGF